MGIPKEEAPTSKNQPSFPPQIEEEGEVEDNGDEDEEEEDNEGEEEEEEADPGSGMERYRAKLERMFRRLSAEKVGIRVHDILIKGNSKTKESVIAAELERLRKVSTMQELLRAATIANARLHSLEIFDSVSITLDDGPPGLPGTANVVVQVQEAKNPLGGDLGIFSKPEARSWSAEGCLKLKNLLGYGDIWDGSASYGWDQTAELSAGLSLPRFGRLSNPLRARLSLLSQDWLKFSSYKEQLLGFSLGLISTRHHDLSYNLTWRVLADPSHASSKSIRRQLGHSLLSSVKYVYKIDKRDSQLRPKRGYAFMSASHIGGLDPDSRSLRFVRQEFDLRYAFPLGFFNAAVNLGISGGVVLPWGKGFANLPSPLPQRFFIGGHSSPVCTLNGPTSLLGFKSRGLGPTDVRRVSIDPSNKEESDASPGRDVLGGDLAVTAFADLSFDLPLKLLRNSGIHGHLFASAGNLAKLTENEFQNFSLRKFGESFRSSVGGGIIVPTKLFRVEINYCYILRQLEYDSGKTGIQFNFSASA
ncbi:Sorting and assembly machinery component 50-like protein [Nymphaea thermarum]|nr:Sorting and assembly machinery component 50-like protein [Nymphaea thermarum]